MKPPQVAKFGGSTFTSPDDYRRVASYLLSSALECEGTVAVVSAQRGHTESLREQLAEVSGKTNGEIAAGLLTTPDVISAYLLAAAINEAGGSSTVLAPHSNGIITDDRWMWARIERMDPTIPQHAMRKHDVVVIAGGPAATASGRTTWLGKNSSDLTAVAAAVNIGAQTLDIHSDVKGVYTADPRLIPDAKPLETLRYGTAYRMAQRGAKVLHRRALAMAKNHDLVIRCRLNTNPWTVGTTLSNQVPPGSVVVIDLGSQLIQCPDQEHAARLHAMLTGEGIETVLPDDLDQPTVAVTGGFVDLTPYLAEDDAAYLLQTGRLVSVVASETVRSYLATDDEDAVRLGRQLHEEVHQFA